MKKKSVSLKVSPAIGTVSGEYVIPGEPKCILTLAHGAGAGMNHPFMTSLAASLASHDIATLRFNFPFAENKKRRPDFPPVAHNTIEAAVRHAQKQFPGLPLSTHALPFGHPR